MTDKVYGIAGPTESLSGALDFFTIETLVDIVAETDDVNEVETVRFEKLIQVISQRAQPIILSAITTRVAEAGEFLGTSETSGGETVYLFKFSVEHSLVWSESGSTDSKAVSLNDSFDGLLGDFIADGVNDNIQTVYAESI